MADFNRTELWNMATAAYAASFDSDYFLRASVQDLGPALELTEPPLSLTALYATSESEKLHKAYFPALDLPLSTTASARRQFAESITSKALFTPDGVIMNVVQTIRSAREAFFDNLDGSAPKGSIHLIGVLALHHQTESSIVRDTYGFPWVHVAPSAPEGVIVAPKPFLDACDEHNPFDEFLEKFLEDFDTPETEDFLRREYHLQKEHAGPESARPLGSFEEFRQHMKYSSESIAANNEAGNRPGIVAIGRTMLAKKYTHRLIQRELFDTTPGA